MESDSSKSWESIDRDRLTRIVARREDSDLFVVFEPSSGIYVFANQSAVDVLQILQRRNSVDDAVSYLRDRAGLSPEDAEARIKSMLNRVLDPVTNSSGLSSDACIPQVWGIGEQLSPERCATFGMPL